jgi:hypothetical protein
MALKFVLTAAAYSALSDEMKPLYIAGDKDGEMKLDVTGMPEPEDTGPLKRALQSEKDAHKETKKTLGETADKLAAVPNVEELKKTHEAEKGKLTNFANKTLRESVATAIASKISTAPALLAPKIAERIAVDLTGDEPKTVFLGSDGKPNAELTAEKIQQEFVANPEYKAIIIASKASGGGAPARSPIRPLGGGAPQDGEQSFDASKANPKDLAARISERKAAEAQQ